MGVRQQADQLKLSRVGILVLIHHNVLKAFLVSPENFPVRTEKLHCFHDQVIKIHGIVFPESLLVFLVCLGNLLLPVIPYGTAGIFLRRYQLIFGRGNCGKNSPLLHGLGINHQTLTDLFHHRFLVVCVINGKVIVIAHPVGIAAQYPHAGGMEGGDPDAVRAYAHNILHTLLHLPRCLVGKGDCHNIPWVYPQFIYQVSNSVGKHTGFSRTCASQQKNRPLCGKDALFLLFIQGIINAHSL